MGSAFTVKYKSINKKLITKIEITYSGNTMNAVALWDTGATDCCISRRVVDTLSLVATGKISMQTPNGVSNANTYLVDVRLPNNVKIDDVRVADSEIGLQGIDMLIGMNIINKGDLSVSNHNDVTTFSFRMPSMGVVDYVKHIKISNIIGEPHGKGKRKKKK